MQTSVKLGRRDFLKLGAASGLALSVAARTQAIGSHMERRVIRATGEEIPVIGLGTSDEFEDIPADGGAELKAVIRTLVEQGGTLIDTAPGYGEAERILGEFIAELGLMDTLFVSTKVKQTGTERGMESLERSQRLLRKDPLDLMMVHSLEDTITQLENLHAFKEAGRVRLVGVTTYSNMRYDFVEDLIRAGRCDVIQVDYSVVNALAEERLIPVAAEHGVAVMVNSAFGNGGYFRALRGRELPGWAAEFECESWAQFSLKYILSNPDVTCVLAATSDSAHMLDNARAGFGPLPDAAARQRMLAHLRDI